MRRSILIPTVLAALAGCDQPAEPPAGNTAEANAAAPAKKHPTYCFFKNADTRGWSVARDASGNVAVKGQAHLADRRYMGAIAESEVVGDEARLWVTMAPNTTGSGVAGDWWDVAGAVLDSGAVTKVIVLCGKKTVAELPVKKG